MKIPYLDVLHCFHDVGGCDCLLVSLILPLDGFLQYLNTTNVAHDSTGTVDEDGSDEDNMSIRAGSTDNATVDNEQEKTQMSDAKERFYKLYESRFKNMKNSTLITREKYDEIVSTLLQNSKLVKGKKLSKKERDCVKIYILIGNITNKCLY
jgi:hypothetical protein